VDTKDTVRYTGGIQVKYTGARTSQKYTPGEGLSTPVLRARSSSQTADCVRVSLTHTVTVTVTNKKWPFKAPFVSPAARLYHRLYITHYFYKQLLL